MHIFDIETAIVALGYLGIFLMMITNGMTSFPSSQVLYIITGYFIFKGDLSLPLVVFFGTLGNTIGCIVLYEITRIKGLKYLLKWKLFPEKEVKKIAVALQKKGIWFLFIGKLLPAIKVFVPIAAGLGRTRRDIYMFLMLLSSAIWAGGFISIGYYFGKSSDVFGKYAIVLAIVAVIVVGLFYKYINSKEVIDELEK